MANKAVYRAKQGFISMIKGQRYHFSTGDLILESHPVKPKSNANFEEISEYVERISAPKRRGVLIEDATAEPGEKRRVGRPRGSKNKAKPEIETPPVEENVAPQAQEEQVSDGEA